MSYLTDESAGLDPIELFEFTYGPTTWRFTEGDAPFTHPIAGTVFSPETISRGAMTQSDEDGSMSVEVVVDALAPIADFFRTPWLPAQQIWLSIFRTHIVKQPNIVPFSRNFLGASGWSVPVGGVGSILMNRPGIDGAVNGGATITDTDAATVAQLFRQINIQPDFQWWTFTYWIPKDADTTRQPRLFASMLGASYITRGVDLNTQTGAVVSSGQAGTTRVTSSVDGLFWIVEVVMQNDGTRTLAQPTIHIAGSSPGSTGSIGLGFIGVEPGRVSSFQTVETALATGANPAIAAEVATIFRGRAGQCVFEGKVAKITCIPTRAAITKRIPVQLVQLLCNNTLYDGRCKADPNAFKSAGTITAISGLTFTLSGLLSGRAAGFFDGGFIGSATKPAATILDHTVAGAVVTLKMLYNPGYIVGDVIDAFAGCDKRFSTCVAKFANQIHHQGFSNFPAQDPFVNEVL